MQLSEEDFDDTDLLSDEELSPEELKEETRIKSLLSQGRVDFPSNDLPEEVTHIYVLDSAGNRIYESNGLPKIKKR
jgi:hypothetical protein